MNRLIINGGKALKGSIEINGAKNAAVAILPAAILASKGECIIDNVPDIADVHCLERIIRSLGCNVEKLDNNTLKINAEEKYIVLRMRMPEERKNLWIPTESETVGMRMHWRCLQMSF